MRCRKHPSDLSSSVGVCASCLRERLIAAQLQAQQQAALDDRRKHDPPPPLVFPRSVSPYVTRRKSDDAAAAANHIRFYSTPQVGPTYNSCYSTSAASKKKTSKFAIFSNLFKSRSDKFNSDLQNPDPYRDTCETSSSFFSTIFSSRRKKHSSVTYLDNPMAADRRDCPISNRGMSPERGTDTDDDFDRSPWGSGGSSEECRKTPMSTAPVAARKTRNGHHHHQSRNVSGLTFCLSPLVRASPNRHWNQKGGLPPDMAFSGEIRTKPHLATAASFCANRSRKLADFGRVNHNRRV